MEISTKFASYNFLDVLVQINGSNAIVAGSGSSGVELNTVLVAQFAQSSLVLFAVSRCLAEAEAAAAVPSVAVTFAEIKKDDVYFGEDGGVTISGGEPFMQAEGLLELLKKCKEAGYSVCIETSGFVAKENYYGLMKKPQQVLCCLFL